MASHLAIAQPWRGTRAKCESLFILLVVGMILKLSLFRAITGCMQNGSGAGVGNSGGGQPPPPAARTILTNASGDPSRGIEDRWQLPGDSPIITSWPFIRWTLTGNPQTASAPRSSVVGSLILATRRPTDPEWQKLDDAPFLSTEVDIAEASTWAHELDIVGAFQQVYKTFADWRKVVPMHVAKVANPTLITLQEDSFATSVLWSSRTGPAELAFLSRTTIGDLLRADDTLSAKEFMPLALSRAIILMGSKDNQAERNNEGSTVRIAAERVTSVLARVLDSTTPSAASLAYKFPEAMRDIQLPFMFRMHPVTSSAALTEFGLAHRYTSGTSAARDAIERDLVLNVGGSLSSLSPILSLFSDPPQAFVQLERLTSQLLPASLASASSLVKFSELDTLLSRAAWSAKITHALNTTPDIAGDALVTALIQSQVEISGPSAGTNSAAANDGPVDNPVGVSSYGSVREQVLGDALRSEKACAALDAAASLSGVELVETLMQSGAVITTRAMLLQEAWLHNKSVALGFCSMAAPSICPYFAVNLTEDLDTGEVPDRLSSYVWPESALAVARTPAWSKLKMLDWAFEINRLSTGTRYNTVSDFDRYTVDSCLRLIRDMGMRFCFALNLSMDPQEGYSFTDGVDLQLKAVAQARTLPARECKELLTFLSNEFSTNWLDEGGRHYHAKLRSARPDHADAQLSEFLPSTAVYMSNVNARLRRMEPIADMRIAFPSLLASDPISLPGTSSDHRQLVDNGDERKGGKRKGKGGGKGSGGKGKGQDDNSPGSKSGYSFAISPQEVFSCGTVFKIQDIAKHYKMGSADQYCWPVLLSKKKGDAALSLCPEHSTHGDIKAKMHARPSNFSLDHVYKQFTRKPTKDENATAGWVPNKKGKA